MTNLLTSSKDDFEYIEPNEALYLQQNRSSKLDNIYDSESLFKKQKNEIIRIKKFNTSKISHLTIKNESKNIFNNEKSNNLNKNFLFINQHNILLNDSENFESIKFNIENINLESDDFFSKLNKLNNNEWTKNNKIFDNYNKSIKLINTAIRSTNQINYDLYGLKLNINFKLKGESQLLIFTRCFINKDLNESSLFDSMCFHKESNDIFNKYTTCIKIYKKEMSNNCFINFGTFTEENNEIIYKTFIKRQLIYFTNNEDNNYYYSKEDECDFNLIINDNGSEMIETKTYLNNSKKVNDVKANFFLPNNKFSKILFCGIGQSVEIKKLLINTYEKPKEIMDTFFNKEKKECNCCLIF